METPVQKSNFTPSLILAALLFVLNWLTGDALLAEVVGPTAYLGNVYPAESGLRKC
ncbi:MAG: hypothetical protein IPH12_07005 [Saprospirales bacterium]|jgi:hypothetical protein|nr:hypothetical protein [Saprospirales bacterium]MBK8922608.1 hypothetical protein [Saprospirales bacterium]